MFSRLYSILLLLCCWSLSVQAHPGHEDFYEELQRNLVPAPARKPASTRQLRAVSLPELTEKNASQWAAFASDNAATTLSDNTDKVKVGGASLLFTTKSGFDTGVRYPATGAAHFNLTSKDRFVFWAYGFNTNSYGFQGNQPIIILRCAGGSIKFVPNEQMMSNDFWRFYSVPLSGNNNWVRTDTGTPDLSDVLSLEIHHDTWGNGFTVHYDGVAFQILSNTTPTVGVPPAGVNPDVIAPRILLYCFDPIMENLGGLRQHQTYRWNDPIALARDSIADLKRSSHGLYQPQIVETVLADEHPYFADGFQHTDESFETAWNVPREQRDFRPGVVFDYARFCREHDIVARVERGEIDEVWFYTAPIGGLWESTMIGDGAYWLNSPPPGIRSKRMFAIMSAGFERGVGETIHGFGHRTESLMARIYGGWQNNQNTNWNKFTLRHQMAPGLGGVGNVHYPVNGFGNNPNDTDHANLTFVPSNADDWANYPNFQNITRTFNSQEWTPNRRDPQREYLNWWYSHIPHGSGVGPDGFLNNWWRYMVDIDQFKDWNGNLALSENIPEVSISRPSNGAAVSGTVNVLADASVDGALGRVDFYVDGVYQATDTLSPYTFAWNTTGLSGVHRLEARAIELSVGNEAISTPVWVNIGELPVPTLSTSDVTVVEGNDGKTQVTFSVTRGGDPNLPVSVAYATSDGSASAESDYVASSGTLQFDPGQLTQTVAVSINGDKGVEEDETFSLRLSSPSNAILPNTRSTGTIQNDDSVVSIEDVEITEGNTSTNANATFTVSLSPALPIGVDVLYSTSGVVGQANAATPDDDYTPVSGTLHFEPNQTTAQVTVPIRGDALFERDEVFHLDLSSSATAPSSRLRATGLIKNDDAMPTLSVVAPTPAVEGNANTHEVVFTVSLSAPSNLPVSVAYVTAPDTATEGSDYTTASGTLNFAPKETTQTISVLVSGDNDPESAETFSVKLSDATDALLATASATATATIQNDDVAISINDVRVSESNTGTDAVFTVSSSPAVAISVDVPYTTHEVEGSADSATPDDDYTPTSGTLHFEPNQTTAQVTVPIHGDTLFERDEVFRLDLTTPTLATISGTGTIANDDTTPTVSVTAPASIVEGNASTQNALFTVSLSAPSNLPVSVAYSTIPGTTNPATAYLDYIALSGTLVFAPKETIKTIAIPVRGDRVDELNEIFVVSLSSPDGATLARRSATATIIDDDTALISVGSAIVTEGNTATRLLRFPITLSLPISRAISVAYSTTAATTARATPPSDYVHISGTLPIAANQTRTFIDVPVVGDTLDEEDERVALVLGQLRDVSPGTLRAEGVILDDDASVRLTINDVTLPEGYRASTATFSVSLSAASAKTVSVTYATANGTATGGTAAQGADYSPLTGTLTFAPGQTTKLINVPIHGDRAIERDERFTLKLSALQNAQALRTYGVCTLVNDDK